ncbi:protein APEM9-like isoform X3 [Miscanthus floridulus]|uniref:protein APEM9-like isoform X3 n=1 Tax=Miscanthus floridulus TaxID=154761 RepID=UPI00345AAD87
MELQRACQSPLFTVFFIAYLNMQGHILSKTNACDQDELLEMLESAGMVLVQALKELRSLAAAANKTRKGSAAARATIQMAAGSVCDLRPIFEEYLTNWRYTNDEVYVLDGEHGSTSNGFVVTSVMSTGQYFQLAELYTVTFICIVSHDSETAISWAEKADLTEQSRQDLLKKLHAVRLAANKKLSTVEGVKQTAERNLSTSTNGSTPLSHEDPPKIAPVCDGLKKVLVKSAQPNLWPYGEGYKALCCGH